MLCVTAAILYLSQRATSGTNSLGALRALGIGLAQACAILPGISRSGSTIGAALMLGVSREEAARFSFLMALIPIGGATLLTLKDLMEAPARRDRPLDGLHRGDGGRLCQRLGGLHVDDPAGEAQQFGRIWGTAWSRASSRSSLGKPNPHDNSPLCIPVGRGCPLGPDRMC